MNSSSNFDVIIIGAGPSSNLPHKRDTCIITNARADCHGFDLHFEGQPYIFARLARGLLDGQSFAAKTDSDRGASARLRFHPDVVGQAR